MRFLISGSSGLIGTALIPTLERKGWEINRLVRRNSNPSDREVSWDITSGRIDSEKLNRLDCVIHLAGESIVGLWTASKKNRIRQSRIEGTRLLSQALSETSEPPKLIICASAIGFYGDRGAEILTEESQPGHGFLPEVCDAWERAAEQAIKAGIRVVHLRIPVVLSQHGGALSKMLPLFRLGLGGTVGGGHHYLSWCTLEEVIEVIHFVIAHEEMVGPVNVGSPHPVTNREFTKTLGELLRRPTPFPVPGFLLKLLLGEMAEEMLLASTRTQPVRLIEAGYNFRHPELHTALRHVLTKT